MKLKKLSLAYPAQRMPTHRDLSTLDNEQREVKREIEAKVIRLETELNAMAQMFAFAREALLNEMLSGMGHKQKGLNAADASKLKELAVGLKAVVELQIKYDKAKKELSKTMTPEEEMDAVFKYIKNLTPTDANKLRDRLNDHGIYKWKS